MSKMISMLEKFKIVEKADNENKEGGVDQVKPLEKTNEKPILSDTYQKVQSNTEGIKQTNREDNKPGYERISYDKNKTIEEIYASYELVNSNINTIFMLGN
ncbi:MAG: hypothetical protein GX201_11560, partial [Clostridiales bacterium]|nr:hypothetical protein [Clostridiales bacterium]